MFLLTDNAKMTNNGSHSSSRNEAFHKLRVPTGFVKRGNIYPTPPSKRRSSQPYGGCGMELENKCTKDFALWVITLEDK